LKTTTMMRKSLALIPTRLPQHVAEARQVMYPPLHIILNQEGVARHIVRVPDMPDLTGM
jgi:hypothetical protein